MFLLDFNTPHYNLLIPHSHYGQWALSLKGQSHELRMLEKSPSQRKQRSSLQQRTLLFIIAAMMDSSALWKYFAWNVLDFFSLTFRTRQIELLSLGEITRM